MPNFFFLSSLKISRENNPNQFLDVLDNFPIMALAKLNLPRIFTQVISSWVL